MLAELYMVKNVIIEIYVKESIYGEHMYPCREFVFNVEMLLSVFLPGLFKRIYPYWELF